MTRRAAEPYSLVVDRDPSTRERRVRLLHRNRVRATLGDMSVRAADDLLERLNALDRLAMEVRA